MKLIYGKWYTDEIYTFLFVIKEAHEINRELLSIVHSV
jgi:hypothetical protein